MDFHLRCNSLHCRAELTERAVVTTCCHVFCQNCASQLGIWDDPRNRKCPACGVDLPRQDDAVTTVLKPSEDYKTSVLSGLSPTTVMECASRGIAFFHYQATQEIHYQSHVVKSILDRYNKLSTQMDAMIAEANSTLENLQGQLQSGEIERKNLIKKNQELVQAYREKSKAQATLHAAYQKLQSHVNAAAVEDAAATNIDQVLNAAAANLPPQRPPKAYVPPRRPSDGTMQQVPVRGGSASSSHRQFGFDNQASRGTIASPIHRQHIPSAPRAGFGSVAQPTRYRMAGGGSGGHDAAMGRNPLRAMDPNAMPAHGHGMSSPTKLSRRAEPAQGGRFLGVKNLGNSIFGLK